MNWCSVSEKKGTAVDSVRAKLIAHVRLDKGVTKNV